MAFGAVPFKGMKVKPSPLPMNCGETVSAEILQLVSEQGLKFDSPRGHAACEQVLEGIVGLDLGQHPAMAEAQGKAKSQSTCGAWHYTL